MFLLYIHIFYSTADLNISVTERVDGIGLARNKYSKYNNPFFNQIGLIVGLREREGEREREKDRQTDRDRDTETERKSSITNLPWITFTFY